MRWVPRTGRMVLPCSASIAGLLPGSSHPVVSQIRTVQEGLMNGLLPASAIVLVPCFINTTTMLQIEQGLDR